jgi:3',5'-cyclic AMP phosphodiesterase CpdA
MQYPRLVVVVLGLAACDSNQSGNLEARQFGDVSRPAELGSPIEEVRDACGDGQAMVPGQLERMPYLQQVTSTSAMIGWVAATPGDQRVELTTPDGTAVATLTAAPEAGVVVARATDRQMWATATGLSPDTVYCYAIVGDAAMTARTGFRTAPAADSTAPIRFLAFGDSGGGGTDQLELRDRMYDYPYELMIHVGDIAYDEGTIDQFEARVFQVYGDLLESLPFFPAPGNHEYGVPDAAPYRSVFAIPGGSGERWYSYDWGRIHFAVLDTEADYATQAAWLAGDLAASQAPWKIVYLHRPPYSSGMHGSDLALRAAIGPVVEAGGVQLVLAGHDHSYERTTPQGGVVYVVTGGGGRGTYSVGQSDFTAFSEPVIHFVYAELDGDELVLHAIDGTGTEFDSVMIPRTRE